MIPRIIHQWWSPPARQVDLPDQIGKNIAEWKKLHPDFVYKLWNKRDIAALCLPEGRMRAFKIIDTCRFPAMQADIIRLVLLSVFGGFWIDLKLAPLCRIDDAWLAKNLVLTQHFDQEGAPAGDNSLINSFIGSTPGHEFIEKALETALRNVENRMAGSIFDITGASIFNGLLFDEPIASYRDALVLQKDFAWAVFLALTEEKYNDNGMHWSERQFREPLYRDLSDASRQEFEQGPELDLSDATKGAPILAVQKQSRLLSIVESLRAAGYLVLPYNERRRAKRDALLAGLHADPTEPMA